jgi:hypothetical protein
MKKLLLAVVMLVTACTPSQEPTSQPKTLPPDTAVTSPAQTSGATSEPMKNPFAPRPDDAKLTRGNVFIEESGILIRESYPPQISLGISGNLPTPCNKFRVQINAPDADNKILIDVYSVTDPDIFCTQVLKPFSENIDLGTFPSGHYTVWLNGQSVGEFDS